MGENMQKNKIDLTRFTDADWEKYNHMKRIANGGNGKYLYGAIVLGIFILIAIPFISMALNAPPVTPYINALNYTTQQWNASLVQLNFTHLNITHNSTIAALTNSLSTHPKILATLVVHEMYIFLYLMAFATRLAPIFALIFLYIVIILVFFTEGHDVPRSTKDIQKHIKYSTRMNNRLRARRYTDEEIAWFHSVRRATLEFAYLG
jgi:uncharacterized membrane protein